MKPSVGERVLTIFVVSAALALGACGDDDDGDRHVRAAIEELHDDLGAGRLSAVCARLSDRSKHQIGTVGHGTRPTTCPRDLAALLDGIEEAAASTGGDASLRDARRPSVVDVVLRDGGDAATATMSLGADDYSVAMVRRDGDWKLADFFGVVGPPPRFLR